MLWFYSHFAVVERVRVVCYFFSGMFLCWRGVLPESVGVFLEVAGEDVCAGLLECLCVA